MKLRYFLTSIVACLALAIGCTKEELPSLSEIQVTPSYFTFGVDGGAKELTVNAIDNWTVTDVPEWLTVSPASGSATGAEGVKVTVTAAATTAEQIVTATLKFTCAGKTQLVTVGQEAYVPDYPKFQAGEYWIMFAEEVAVPVSSSYGYLYTAKANKSEDGKLSSTADNIFTFTEVEGGFSIQDAAGKFYAMKGTYTSFNLYDTAQENYVFTVKQTGDDKFVITNANGKVMQYDPAYSSAGAYDSEKSGAIYPNLVSVAGAEIAEILFAVEPTEVALETEAGEFNINMTCKNEAFEINPSADWITVKGMTSTNGEYVVTFSYTENTGAARTATIDFVSGEETITVNVSQEGSIAEVSVADFLAAAEGPALYKLTGQIANIAMDKNDPTKVNAYGNFDLIDATGSVYVYGLTATPQASNDKSFASLGLQEGDIVTIIGTRSAYNGTAQVGGPAYYVSHIGHTAVTVSEFLAASESADTWYKLTGTVSDIAMDKNDPTKVNAYGNFNLTDETGTVYVYGLTKNYVPGKKNDKSFESIGLKNGDVVTIIGTRSAYNGTAQVGGTAYYISHESDQPGGEEPETPVTPGEGETSEVKTLTNAEICAAMTSSETSYVEYTIESASGVWTVNASQNKANTFLQCRGKKGGYIKTPEFDKDIKSVTIHFTSAKSVYSDNTYCVFPSTWVVPTADAVYPEDGNVGKAVTDGSYSLTIPVDAGNKQVYVSIIGTYSYYLDHIDVAF